MDLINKKVKHSTFGRGHVVNYDDSYIKINFESGTKKFVFPDAFKNYITFVDQGAADLVSKKIKEKEAVREKEALRIKKENALEQERQHILKQAKYMKNRKINPELQCVFWCEDQEEDQIFTDWKVSTGIIKSGLKKGQPRRLARINQNSACLFTRREPDMLEKDRQILGVFMVDEGYDGKLSKEEYIPAHSKHRLRLSKQESEKMLFWNYYVNKKQPDQMRWNLGKQRYFDNVWMAQILQDIVSLKEESQEKVKAQLFFEYFCQINHINIFALPKANGTLKQI